MIIKILLCVDDKQSFSGGAVAGIAIAAVVGVLLLIAVGVGIWVIVKVVEKRKSSKPISTVQ